MQKSKLYWKRERKEKHRIVQDDCFMSKQIRISLPTAIYHFTFHIHSFFNWNIQIAESHQSLWDFLQILFSLWLLSHDSKGHTTDDLAVAAKPSFQTWLSTKPHYVWLFIESALKLDISFVSHQYVYLDDIMIARVLPICYGCAIHEIYISCGQSLLCSMLRNNVELVIKQHYIAIHGECYTVTV